MNLKDARWLIEDQHVEKAASLIDENGFEWLYERTGRIAPQHRYVVVNGRRYPTKAFGFLAAQLAGNTQTTQNDMTVNEAYAPLKRLGYIDVSGTSEALSENQRKLRAETYYLQLARPDQAKFRSAICLAYGGRCAVSGVGVLSALEAAHIEPFRGGGIDEISNGLLLRADFHRLFDYGQLAFQPKGDVVIARFSTACGDDYREFNGAVLRLPTEGPKGSAFAGRWAAFES